MKKISFLFFLCSLVYLLKPLLIGYYADFSVHYDSANALLERVNPYIDGGHFFIPDVYPPFSQFFFIPFTFISAYLAGELWVVLSIVFYLFSILLLMSIFSFKWNDKAFLFVGLINFTFFPLKFTLGMGQVNTLVLLFCCLFLYFLKQNKNPVYAGSALAMSVLWKLFPFFVLPYLFLKRKYSVLAWLFSVVGLVVLLSSLLFGVEIHVYFIREVLPSLLGGWKDYYYNQSIAFPIAVLFAEDSPFRIVSYVFFALLLLIPAVYLSLKRPFSILALTTIFTVTLLVSRFTWQHHLVLLLPSFFCVSLYISNWKSKMGLLLGISYGLVAANISKPLEFPLLLQSHALIGMILLYGMQLYIWFQNKKIKV